tara:strand:- start:322 stop:468 length:147 start_codon:yes stop_codon:yes gene_type:complete
MAHDTFAEPGNASMYGISGILTSPCCHGIEVVEAYLEQQRRGGNTEES